MQSSALREQVIRHFRRHAGQFLPGSLGTRVYQSLTPEAVFDLLDNASLGCRPDAKALLLKMSSKDWTITSAPKEGGFKADDKLHFSLRIPYDSNKNALHCYCHETPGGLYVHKITDKPGDADGRDKP